AHHHELVDALRAGDSDWAESVMRSHVRAAWSSIREGQPLGSEQGETARPATPSTPPPARSTAPGR
ncbi:MAG: FCD domain-containing protein, partial [Marmoricola sp.]